MRKKLIEVALPLEAINKESVRENYIYKGNPSAVHKWWAQRPLAACRAVLFAQLVDDPSSHPELFPTEKAQEEERNRLFRLIEEIVKWENMNREEVLERARDEILKSAGTNGLPSITDPFAGGGSIPLEALRLGLEAYASDLNPVAVLINKALIEIPPRFSGQASVHPQQSKTLLSKTWQGAAGLAEDIRFYGRLLCEEAEKRVGYLYPKVNLPKGYGGSEATVIAWLWARTVKCPNPACGAQMPLVRSFALSTRKGKQAYASPVIDKATSLVSFEVKTDKNPPPAATVGRRGARCVACGASVPLDYVRAEGKSGRMGTRLMAIVAEGQNGRLYVSPTPEHEECAKSAHPEWAPDAAMAENPRHMTPPLYGMNTFAKVFTSRQLVAMGTFCELVRQLQGRVLRDAIDAGLRDDEIPLRDGGKGCAAYADAVATYLAFICDKVAAYGCSLVPWYTKEDRPSWMFGRQAISMTWDFAEINPFTSIGGSAAKSVSIIADSIEPLLQKVSGFASQADAASAVASRCSVISTDPPYFDNVPYADLSDFFYVWLRRSLGPIYPELFSTLLVPKQEELVADAYRHGGKGKAEEHFVAGIRKAFTLMRQAGHPDYPLTVYYAFKQSEIDSDGDDENEEIPFLISTGWETMLDGLIEAGFTITGTWPLRTERTGRLRDTGSNALASSIVLACRSRSESAPLATRREFIAALKRELPDALKKLQHGNIAPVDFAQASIGPGMAIFSRYAKVLEADGNPMSVRTALQIINQELDAYLAAQEGEMDRDTRFCLAWFEQYGMNEGLFGEADVLARAKNTAVQGLVEAGVIHSRAGKVRLLRREEYPGDWNPLTDARVVVWECAQHLIQRLNTGGEEAAARLVNQLGGGRSEEARALAYRLYSICERKKWADEALAYNTLVVSWPAIQDKAAQLSVVPSVQAGLFE